MINIGDMAPDLLGLDEAGNEIKLSQYRGQKGGALLLSERQHFGLHCRGL